MFAFAPSPLQKCMVYDTVIRPRSSEFYRWKIGQLGAGNTVQFRRIPFANALRLKDKCEEWFTCVQKAISGDLLGPLMNPYHSSTEDKHEDPRLQAKLSSSKKPLVVFRQVCLYIISQRPYLTVRVGGRLGHLN